MSDKLDEGDGLDAFRGLMWACALSVVVWVLVIGAYCLGRAAPDVHSEPSRSAKASKVA